MYRNFNFIKTDVIVSLTDVIVSLTDVIVSLTDVIVSFHCCYLLIINNSAYGQIVSSKFFKLIGFKS